MKSSNIKFSLFLYKVHSCFARLCCARVLGTVQAKRTRSTRQAAIALTVAMAFVSSCKEKDEDPTLSVAPDAAEVVFSADGATLTAGGTAISATFNVSTNQKEWNVEWSQSSWLTVTPDKAKNTFTLSATRNTSMEPPVAATVTVTAGTAPKVTITVKQAAALPLLELSESEVVINAAGTQAAPGSLVITVNTTYLSWKAESDQTWLTVTEEESEKKFTLSASANEFTAQKTATVTVTAGAATVTLPVSQSGNPAGMAAATTQTWEVIKADQTIKQMWSDYIQYDGDGKVAAGTITQFANSMDVGQYRDNPGYKGYVYNLAYVQANQEKLCPAPWRVPSPNDLKNLDRALGGDGSSVSQPASTPEADIHAKKYEATGFEYSGRFNPTTDQFQYANGVGYITSNSTAETTIGDANKASHLLIRNPNQNGDWAVFPWNEGSTSQTKNFGLPVRCVKGDVIAIKPEYVLDACASLDGWVVWGGNYAMTLEPDGMGAGKPCISVQGTTGQDDVGFFLLQKNFDPFDTKVTKETGIIAFDIYVSDPSRVNNMATNIQVASGGGADANAFYLHGSQLIERNNLQAGWNSIEWDLATSNVSAAGVNLKAINYVRFLLVVGNDAPFTVMVANIRFLEK